MRGLASRRPAESLSVAAALAYLIVNLAGLDDPGIAVAMTVVIGFIPTAVTFTVELFRGKRNAAAGASGP